MYITVLTQSHIKPVIEQCLFWSLFNFHHVQLQPYKYNCTSCFLTTSKVTDIVITQAHTGTCINDTSQRRDGEII